MKALLLPVLLAAAASGADLSFKKVVLTDEFWSEGVACGDFNHDGKPDVSAGPYWWAGPDFQARHAFRSDAKTSTFKTADGTEKIIRGYKGALAHENDYSDDFYTFARDLNGDGWDDLLVVGLPSTKLRVYLNPKKQDDQAEPWPMTEVFGPVDNESPAYVDLTGDGKPDLVCNSDGYFGYAQPGADPAAPWTFHRISPKGTWHKYTHGLGVGDVNGDGRADLLEQDGWWEQPASLAGDPVWTNHPVPFAPQSGAAEMFAYDVNGDKLADVITCLQPHGYGMAWYEQYREGAEIRFRPHAIAGKEPKDSPHGIVFSQPHAQALIDLDGDGALDLVTGKRFWAHGPEGDVEPNAPAVLYAFRLVRTVGGADFVPTLLDDASGVGMHVASADFDKDGRTDLAIANKRGVFVFVQRPAAGSR
jgi:hypothetical protein